MSDRQRCDGACVVCGRPAEPNHHRCLRCYLKWQDYAFAIADCGHYQKFQLRDDGRDRQRFRDAAEDVCEECARTEPASADPNLGKRVGIWTNGRVLGMPHNQDFGFITHDGGKTKVFFHKRKMEPEEDFEKLSQDKKVSYVLDPKPVASNVRAGWKHGDDWMRGRVREVHEKHGDIDPKRGGDPVHFNLRHCDEGDFRMMKAGKKVSYKLHGPRASHVRKGWKDLR